MSRAFAELVAIEFLEPMATADRYFKVGRGA